MSTDDFCFENPEKFLEEWLNRPYGRFSTIKDNLDNKSLSFLKEAFLYGYNLGIKARTKVQWIENNYK